MGNRGRPTNARPWATAGAAFVLANVGCHFTAGSGYLVARSSGRIARTDLRTGSSRRRTGLATRNSRRIAGASNPMTLWRHRRDRVARMGRNNAWTFKLRRMRGGRDRGMTVIVVERKRRIFRRRLHVARLFGRRLYVPLFFHGELFGRWLRCGATGAAIIADIGRVVNDDGLVVDVGDRHVRNIVHRLVVEELRRCANSLLHSRRRYSRSRKTRRRKNRFAVPNTRR